MKNQDRCIKTETYWLLSNIVAEGFQYAVEFAKRPHLLKLVLDKFLDGSEPESAKVQIAYVFRNFIANTI